MSGTSITQPKNTVALLTLAVVAVGLAFLVSLARPGAVDPQSQSDQSPTDSAPPWPPAHIEAGSSMEREITSLDAVLQPGVIVADVEVERVMSARYNTPSGEHPTQSSDGDEAGLFIFSPVVLRVTRWYTGEIPNVDGFVVIEDGGIMPEVTFSIAPLEPFTGPTSYTEGMAFLTSFDGYIPMSAEGNWISIIQSIAQEHSLSSGRTYIAGDWEEFYGYDDDGMAKALRGISSYAPGELQSDVVGRLGAVVPRPSP